MTPSERILEVVNAHKVLDNKEPDTVPTTYWGMAIVKFLNELFEANPELKMPKKFPKSTL